jgi:hypothetical protein
VSVPAIVVVVPVEGTATARLCCSSAEEETRIARDLCERDVLFDVLGAIADLCDKLAVDSDEGAS